MRKFLIVGMVLLLGVAAAGLAGCGGNTSQAKTDTKAADAAYAKVKTELDNLGNQLTSVLGGAISGNYSALTPAILAQATTGINQILADMPAVITRHTPTR
jgi:outer membrane protein TolC